MKPERSRKRFATGLRILATIAILWLLLNAVGGEALGDAVRGTEWTWLIGMYAATLAFVVINSAMLKSIMNAAGLRVGLRRVMLANSLSTFYTLILPGDALAGLAKWADLSAATGDKPRVLAALVFGKAALALPPLVFGTLALAIHNPFPEFPLSPIAGGLCLAVVTGASLVLGKTSGPAVDRAVGALIRS